MTTLASLLIQETKAQIYARGLALATTLGLPTTSWAPGDPTRSLYHFLSDVLVALEANVVGFIKSGFLEYATGDWLTVLAKQIYNVDRVEATFAIATVTLSNAGGGYYVIAPGDIAVRNSTTGKTYTVSIGGTLTSGPGTTLDITVIADEAGSASSALAGEIDALVTTMIGVTCASTTAAVGLDAEQDPSLRDRCRAKLAMLSPDGPRAAYDFVVRDSTLTGVLDITRSRTIADAGTGIVTTYVGGVSGPVAGASIVAAQAAVERWAAPWCTTPLVANAIATTIAVNFKVWIYASVGEISSAILAKIASDLALMLAARPIGGDIVAPSMTGKVYVSLIEATIKASYPNHIFRVVMYSPATDTALAINAVPLLGVVTSSVDFEVDP